MDLLLLSAYVIIAGAFLLVITRSYLEKHAILWSTLFNLTMIYYAVVNSFQDWLSIAISCLVLIILITLIKILGRKEQSIKLNYFMVIISMVVAKALESPEIVIITISIPLVIYPLTEYYLSKKNKSKAITSTEPHFLIFFWSVAAISYLVNNLILLSYGITIEYSVYYSAILSLMVVFLLLKNKELGLVMVSYSQTILFLIYHFNRERLSDLPDNYSLNTFFMGLILALIIGLLGLKKKALTLDGMLSGAFLGALVFGFGGWSWGLMFALFFIIGSGATFIGKEKKQEQEAGWEKGETARDSLQVLSKGFWGMICALIYVVWPNYGLMVAYMASMATSLADTLGSEIGVLSPWKPRKITRLWEVSPPGTSGAVSLVGELATLAGGLIIGGLAFFVVPLEKEYSNEQMYWMIIIVILASFIAANLDSLMSATIQKMYSCKVCGKEVEGEEHCEQKAIRLRGIGWINNDRVNMLAVLSAVIIGLGLSLLV
ncbi:MAG: DUF92 domain-containing protein [Candidatus Kariarchaeaceae archaeon]